MNRPRIAAENIYHVYNRGVDKRDIFLDDIDHFRFLKDIFEFNSEESSSNFQYFSDRRISFKEKDIFQKKPKKPLVDIFAFVLMPNHFHLLVKARKDFSITKFMRKVGVGYTNYFNIKYERSGALFQGKYKYTAIVDDRHLLHLPYYIHANPLKLKFPLWQEKGLDKKTNEAIKFLDSYYWSSLSDYEGRENFSAILKKDFLLELYGEDDKSEEKNCGVYKESFEGWLKEHEDVKNSVDELNYRNPISVKLSTGRK